MTEHNCLCQFTSQEWRDLSHDDFDTLIGVATKLLAAAPMLTAFAFPVALGAHLSRRLAGERDGLRARQWTRLLRVVHGRTDDTRRFHHVLLPSEAAS
jgi:hypothetical protein